MSSLSETGKNPAGSTMVMRLKLEEENTNLMVLKVQKSDFKA